VTIDSLAMLPIGPDPKVGEWQLSRLKRTS